MLLSVGKAKTRIVGLQQNPVKDWLQVQVVSGVDHEAYATLSDTQGRILGRFQTQLSDGLNQWTISASYLASGVYFLSDKTADGMWETLRVMKQ